MDNVILKTHDYTIFKKLNGNRDVDEKRVKGLMKSIEKIGWISNPIIVNRKMEVIDGQGRLEALRRLGLPVEYHIVDNANLDNCRTMNSNNTAWKTNDYIKSFADSGNKDFQRIQYLMNYFDITLDILMMAAGKTDGSSRAYHRIREGSQTFDESNYITASRRLNVHKKYRPAFKRFGGRVRTDDAVIMYIIKYGETHQDTVDHDKIVDALEKCAPKDIHPESFERLLESVQNVYNYNKTKKNRLYFYEEYRLDTKL